MTPSPRLLAYGALAAVLATGAAWMSGHQHGVTAERVRQEASEAQALRAVMERLQQRTAEVEALRQQQQQARAQAEASYAGMQSEIDRQRGELARLGRLRDPGARPAGGCAVPAAAGGAGVSAGATTGAELSAAATGFLRDFAWRCDRAAAYATAAHRWAVGK